MKISNFKELAASEARKVALEIAEAGLAAIDTAAAVRRTVSLENGRLSIAGRKYGLAGVEKLLIIGIGKCALEAGAELEKILGNKLNGGIIVDVHQPKLEIKNSPPKAGQPRAEKLEIFTGTHPLPSEQNIDITKKVIERLRGLSEKDFVIFIVSGGGSTLLCQPKDLTCYNEADILTNLFRQGAAIKEINTVRKHLSLARGGWLAKYLYPAGGVALIFSDVPGNELEFVASGPTVKDTTTVSDAEKIIKKYRITELCGFKCNLLETPKEDKYFEKIENVLLVSNQTALEAMKLKAVELGFKAEIKTDILIGEAREAGKRIVEDLKRAGDKTVLLYGGETTVTLCRGKPAFAKATAGKGGFHHAEAELRRGEGGRNQELALSTLNFLNNGQLILALASDGRDNTDFAGAIADILTKKKAKKLSLKPEQYLDNNNSYDFFRQTGDFIMTGDTGSNVSDLVIAISV